MEVGWYGVGGVACLCLERGKWGFGREKGNEDIWVVMRDEVR